MPCGKEVVVDWPQTPGNVETFCRFLQQDRWFGFAEVDIEVLRELWETFEEMPQLFYNNWVSSKAVPQHMKDYLARSKRNPCTVNMCSQVSFLRTFSPKNLVILSTAKVVCE